VNRFLVLLGAALQACFAVACWYWGYRAHIRELNQWYHEHRCPECGAEPTPKLIHVSGCESGWRDPSKWARPGEL
jgi:hypothetical protein